jgi:Cadherin-like beta sandwich domain/Uncharacterised protein conserved in bacteria (DUF2194)/Divergent InlB B-repeat domain/Dockerin type I domain
MKFKKKVLGIFFALAMVVAFFVGTGYVRAATTSAIPIKVAIMYDASNTNTNQTSDLYANITRVLKVNKIPFDSFDISSGQHPALQDSSANLLYSAVVLMADGTAIDPTNSTNIVSAVNAGIGVVATLPDTANPTLSPIFGISTLGTVSTNSAYFTVSQDIFTFSYSGTTMYQASTFENHTLVSGVNIEASFPSLILITGQPAVAEPAIWTYKNGTKGMTVYHNTTATNTMCYWGIMLQSILYAMPVGVSCPVNAMALDVDDCPTSYYSSTSLQEDYYDFLTNYVSWLKDYNARSTFFTAFSYSGNASSFWDDPQSLQAAADIIESGNELGLHCGDLHLPLDADYWGISTNVESESNTTNQAIQALQQGLKSRYGIDLGDISSYVAPGNCMTDEAYQALEDYYPTIEYVGEGFGITPQSGGAVTDSVKTQGSSNQKTDSKIADALNAHNEAGSNATQAQIISEILVAKNKNPFTPSVQNLINGNATSDPVQYSLTVNVVSGSSFVTAATVTETPTQSTYAAGTQVSLSATLAPGWVFVDWSGSNDLSSTTTNPATITMNSNEAITLLVTYPETYADFGYNASTPDLYNLPRIEGGIPIFGQPTNPSYPYSYENLLTCFESGQPYIAFIHPDEENLGYGANETLADVFNALTIWGNYIATNYPFYQWMTSTQIGDYLSSRSGTFSANWVPGTNTLTITLAQPDDPIHIKSSKYIQSISRSGNTMTIAFSDSQTNFQSSQYDVMRVASDYFISPLNAKSLMPVKPSTPFVYQSVTEPDSTPMLNGIGNQQAVVGQPFSFTVSGADANSEPLTYAASNLPSGASFNPATQTFSWTPSVAGLYSGIQFSVSDGATSSNEEISINVSSVAPSNAEIDIPISGNINDGYNADSGNYPTSTSAEIGNSSQAGSTGQSNDAWFQFTGVTLPKNAIILHAYLQTVQTSWTAGTILKISGDNASSPSVPTSALDQISLPRTTAQVNWTSGTGDNAYHNSPDISAVIQELVTNYDYSSGGNIQLLVDNYGSATGAHAIVNTFDNSPAYAPKLDIVYQTGSPSNADQMTTYGFSGENGPATINAAVGTINVSMPIGTNLASLAATFVTSPGVSSVKVGGVSQVSGTTTNNFNNPVTYTVTAQDGISNKVWVVTVTEAASSDATLSNLTISSGTLSPAFASGTTTYSDTVANTVTSVTVTPTVNQSNATVKVNGNAVTSGSPSGATSLNVGSNIITVTVTAQDGTTTDTYAITVTDVIPGDANGDGVVNILDMTKCAREILGLDPLTPGADANGDGNVNVLDMTKIVRIILGLDSQ